MPNQNSGNELRFPVVALVFEWKEKEASSIVSGQSIATDMVYYFSKISVFPIYCVRRCFSKSYIADL